MGRLEEMWVGWRRDRWTGGEMDGLEERWWTGGKVCI